jgi:hypothetical protein
MFLAEEWHYSNQFHIILEDRIMDDETRSSLEIVPRGISRRDFMVQSGAVALGAAGMGLLAVPS